MQYLTKIKDRGNQTLGRIDYHWMRLAVLVTLLSLFVLAAGAPDDGNGILTGS